MGEVGFEPTHVSLQMDLQSIAFSHSATLPVHTIRLSYVVYLYGRGEIGRHTSLRC